MKKYLLLALMFSGLITSAQTSITNGNCKAAFKYVVNDKLMSPIAATAINFYDHSEGNIKLWFWDFGDGKTSNEQNPMFIFIHPLSGITLKMSPYRTVSLTVLTSDNCKSMHTETINIMDGSIVTTPSCSAGFKYYQEAYDSIGKTATIQFTNLSVGDSLQYAWKFDNGKTSADKEPKVTFDLSQKERKVCLTVIGSNKCTNEFCDAVYITIPDKPVVGPIDPKPVDCETAIGYSVNYNIKTFAPALVLDFHSKAWPEPTEWKWDFGDGTTSSEANPTHIFNYPITNNSIPGDPNPFRKVCLTVKTSIGCMASSCQTINIYMDKPPIEPVLKCKALFKYYKATDMITIPEVVAYKLKDVSEGKVISRLWTFENGKTSLEAEPIVTFDIFKPIQKVCLTIYTADSCSSSWCETIYVSAIVPDNRFISKPAGIYSMRYDASFPVYMSSCAGWAKAQVYMKDSLIKANNYVWSNGTLGQETKGLCPTRAYSVKAITPDGTVVSGTFIFNSNGTVTEIPVTWSVADNNNNPLVSCNFNNKNYTVEWRLCDGTIVVRDTIPLNSINCGGNESNMILKDATGNLVYAETISLKSVTTGIVPDNAESVIKLFPNPVNDVLNILYSGNRLNEMQLEICDITGRSISIQKFYDVQSGQQFSLNVNLLGKGIYLCKMLSEKKVIRIDKFIK
jgi:PKD repeat protein